MAGKRPTRARYVQPYRYPSPDVPITAIRRFARQIAERFHPEKIILFGSYAYGTPHNESDVDLMVIMPARNVIDQAIRIRNAMDRPFAHEIHVRTPYQMKARLKEGDCDWFLREVVDKGKVLYEAPHGRDVACFHCQQAAEKYLKALLQDLGLAVPRTHDLEVLLDLLLPHDATLAPLRRGVRSLTKFAVEYRYPAMRATTRQMQASVRQTERVRTELRARLGLPP